MGAGLAATFDGDAMATSLAGSSSACDAVDPDRPSADAAVPRVARYDLWDAKGARPSSLETAVLRGSPSVSMQSFEMTIEDAAIAALLDRPVAATGAAMPIGFANALVVTVHAGTPTRLFVLASKAVPFGVFPLALENAYIAKSGPTVLELGGRLQGRARHAEWCARPAHAARFVLPTLPDPYLARYIGKGNAIGAQATGVGGFVLAFTVWANPSDAPLNLTLVPTASAPSQPQGAYGTVGSERRRVSGFAELLDVSTNADLLGVFIHETAASLGFEGVALTADPNDLSSSPFRRFRGNRCFGQASHGASSATTTASPPSFSFRPRSRFAPSRLRSSTPTSKTPIALVPRALSRFLSESKRDSTRRLQAVPIRRRPPFLPCDPLSTEKR